MGLVVQSAMTRAMPATRMRIEQRSRKGKPRTGQVSSSRWFAIGETALVPRRPRGRSAAGLFPAPLELDPVFLQETCRELDLRKITAKDLPDSGIVTHRSPLSA